MPKCQIAVHFQNQLWFTQILIMVLASLEDIPYTKIPLLYMGRWLKNTPLAFNKLFPLQRFNHVQHILGYKINNRTNGIIIRTVRKIHCSPKEMTCTVSDIKL